METHSENDLQQLRAENSHLKVTLTVLRDELAKIDAKRKQLLGLYDKALDRLRQKVSSEGRSEDAERIDEERQRIRASL